MSKFNRKVAAGTASWFGSMSAQFCAQEGAKVTVANGNTPDGQETVRLI